MVSRCGCDRSARTSCHAREIALVSPRTRGWLLVTNAGRLLITGIDSSLRLYCPVFLSLVSAFLEVSSMKRCNQFRPVFEALCDRICPSTTLSGNVLSVVGTAGADAIVVRVNAANHLIVRVNGHVEFNRD